MTTVLIDYDSGNLHSAEKAFQRMAREVGAGDVIVSDRAEDVAAATRIVLPGDGAFPSCRAALAARTGLQEALLDAVENRAVPFMGICIGMQMMCETGHEYEETPGFGWIPGDCVHIEAASRGLKVPHMGWNDLIVTGTHPVLEGLATGDHAYFVHAYHMRVTHAADRLAHVDYGGEVTAIVAKDNMIGTQFHPEKSQAAGLRMIANFLQWAP